MTSNKLDNKNSMAVFCHKCKRDFMFYNGDNIKYIQVGSVQWAWCDICEGFSVQPIVTPPVLRFLFWLEGFRGSMCPN